MCRRASTSVDLNTLERLVPDALAAGEATGCETLALHLARFEFAAQHARPGRLLDLACGVGLARACKATAAARSWRRTVWSSSRPSNRRLTVAWRALA